MKKALSPINIDKELYTRMSHMLKVNPESGYKSRTQFVEKVLDEKLDEIENDMVLKMIKDEGIMGFKEKARNLLQTGMQIRKGQLELEKIVEQNLQEMREFTRKDKHTRDVEEIKKKIRTNTKKKRLLTKQKHTLEVYNSKKK